MCLLKDDNYSDFSVREQQADFCGWGFFSLFFWDI